ncbi:bifunctional lysylphosphatidylglycerol flippase/synthetase MprF [Bremerella cremea]|uniref:Phosphatidylglycerol lysyltransferase n=1 Tax=Bremerella cremea TaxID=1031537 RepID=A0A368KPV3_9BACT|nr:bifunctional lysylphosphatidylglycerol flippase/synthetase MprF [Bremerella cremea]RCS43914.1 bifunctional lysylphosphatidylglycerol flippase/synthetase MprF [Bremerella cremea]
MTQFDRPSQEEEPIPPALAHDAIDLPDESRATWFSWLTQHYHTLLNILTVVMFGGALWLLHYEFRNLHAHDVAESFETLPWQAVVLSLFFTVLNYAVMIGYDWLAVNLIDHVLKLRQVAIVSFLYYSFSNTLGSVFGGTPIRVRLYASWGMTSPEIVRMILLIAAAFWMGLFTLGGTLFLFTPFDIPARFNLPLTTSRPLGAILLSMVGLFFVVCWVRQRPLHWMKINFQPPPLRIALAQTLVSATDFMCASAALYVLLPKDAQISFLPFTAIFILAIIVSLVSHVPGGLGVLELVVVTMLPFSDSHGLLASLLAYRVIYYLLPLTVGLCIVGVATFRQHAGKATAVGKEVVRWTSVIGPSVVTGGVFVAGLILLISGSLPAEKGRMALLREFLPLPVVEVSHLLGSVIGALLLVLARGLQRRIDAAWLITCILLGCGVLVTLAKGFDYEEAIVLFVLLLALLPCRSHFFRKGQLLSPNLSPTWLLAVVLSLGLIFWIVMFAYRHVEYNNDLWWEFAYRRDAPRSLRALLAAAVTITVFAVASLLRPKPITPTLATDEELAEVADLVTKSEATHAHLALLGDKRFVFSHDRQAAVMFGCQGNCWITMGDPFGQAASMDDAAWNFREACDAAGTWPVFYQVSQASLSRYVEMGLTLIKLGEEARVSLVDFSLEGSQRRGLRHTDKKCQEAGLTFEVVPQADVAEIMPRMKEISDAWLGDKSTGEKGFSLGFFREEYLSRYDIALVRDAQGTAIAFANIWRGADKQELSLDLMRYVPDAQRNVMEYLFIELMRYGHQQGYQWFNLGMAPLSGIDANRLGPLWNRVCSVVYQHGEHFYNFQGLRNYKDKFDPVWSPKYLASPGGIALPQVLANVSTLISGGVGKLLHR